MAGHTFQSTASCAKPWLQPVTLDPGRQANSTDKPLSFSREPTKGQSCHLVLELAPSELGGVIFGHVSPFLCSPQSHFLVISLHETTC